MKRKNVLNLLLATAITAGMFTGCGSSNRTADSADPSATATAGISQNQNSASPVNLDIFQFKVEFKDAFDSAVEAYKKINPNVTVNVQTMGGGADYGAALKTKFNSGEEPAIFNVGGPSDVDAWKSKLADLSQSNSAKQALDGTLAAVSTDGKVYGLPYNIEGFGLIYNKEVFKKAGIDPASINSYAKLEEAVKTIDAKKKELGLEGVFALPAKETWVTGNHLSNAFIAAEFDGDIQKIYKAKTIEFKFADAMKKVLDLQNKYSVQPTISMDYSTQVEKLFSNGKVALIQQGNWAYPTIAGIDEEFAKNNIGMIPYPVPGYKEDCYNMGVPMYWAVNNGKSEEVKKAAVDFLDWLYTSDEGKKIVIEQFKFVPAYKGYSNDSVSDPLGKQLLTAANEGKTMNYIFQGYPDGWGMQKLGADMQLYLCGKLDWNKLIENGKRTWADARK